MRSYVVQEGDTPASIAAKPDLAGCPKCARDLIAANPHKAAAVMPNGFITFRELHAGERLNLPEKWFDGTLDRRPRAYFSALPYADGRTPSTLGDAAVGILGDYATLDSATARVAALGAMDDQDFSNAVDGAADLIDRSVREAASSVNPGIQAYSQAVKLSTGDARQRNTVLVETLGSGDQAEGAKARADVQTDLSTAIDAAHLALQAIYGDAPVSTPPPVVTPAPVTHTPTTIPRAPTPAQIPSVIPPQKTSNAGMVGLAVLAVAAAGGGVYLASKKKPFHIRRVFS